MGQENGDIRIPVTVGGITFKNPFYVASGPTTKSVQQLLRIEKAGWAAASIKLSIDPAPYINLKPRYAIFPEQDALAFTAEKRLTFAEGLQLIAEAKRLLKELKLMANITYAGDAGVSGWVNMAKQFEIAGADIIELNMCCPNMSYNLETTSGGNATAGHQTGASMGQRADVASEIVRAIKKEIHIPLFVKLTPEGGRIAQVARELYASGADAVGGTGNRLGMPPIDLDDPGKAFCQLQDEISMGCYSSRWLKPLAQRDTYEIRKVCGENAPIMAAGGIADWRDAVEMILCGGTLLGVCSETLISGFDIIGPMLKGLQNYMQDQGYTDVEQMRGLVVPQVRTATDLTIHAGYAKIKEPNLSAPCKSACPHHIPVQAYVQKIAQGKFREAYDLVTQGNALQGVCALVCPSPCESACLRGRYDSPVKIRALKRFVLEYGEMHGWMPKWAAAVSNGHSVAVIGSGPSGLACATELRKAGYKVAVFEKESEAGGGLRFGVPTFAGHIETLERELVELSRLGIQFVFNTEFGRDVTVQSLQEQGYERIVTAVGQNKSLGFDIPGAEFAEDAAALMRQSICGQRPQMDQGVVVVGKEDTAIAAARYAIRMGANPVTLLWAGVLPKLNRSIRQAQEEGVIVIAEAKPKEILPGGIRFTISGAQMELSAGKIYLAADEATTACPISGTEAGMLFTVREHPSNIIAAITAGKNCAATVDAAIMGQKAVLRPVVPVKTVDVERVQRRIGYLPHDAHTLPLERSAGERAHDFNPIERTMTDAEAIREAERCLNCGCGEGCQLCKTICAECAPVISAPDTVKIQSDACVACGMCYHRCPNGNIEMVDLGVIK